MRESPWCLHVRGQGIVEFAVALPIFLLLTFGIIELGWLVYSNHTLNSATREGARYAMVHGERSGDLATVGKVEQVVRERSGGLNGEITVDYLEWSPKPPSASDPDPDVEAREPGSLVTVSTSYEYRPIIGMMLGVGEMTLNGESTVIVQY